ncbi:hypothetical protein [Kitasatospora sp. NPDC050463]|uniref:hypothetical protein n=1 Tax=Kitasatospora sp. NPDC050463 TaxID=3155786 RepID=UPI0033CDD240
MRLERYRALVVGGQTSGPLCRPWIALPLAARLRGSVVLRSASPVKQSSRSVSAAPGSRSTAPSVRAAPTGYRTLGEGLPAAGALPDGVEQVRVMVLLVRVLRRSGQVDGGEQIWFGRTWQEPDDGLPAETTDGDAEVEQRRTDQMCRARPVGSAISRVRSGAACTSTVAVRGSSRKRQGRVLWIEGAATAAEIILSGALALRTVDDMLASWFGREGRKSLGRYERE